MPGGKPAGVRCVNLDPASHLCRIWGTGQYPDVCRKFAPDRSVCGNDRGEALELLQVLECATGPGQ